MKKRMPTDYVILGTLLQGERYGYEIMRFLEGSLEGAFRVSTSQLYVVLKRMEREGLLVSRAQAQGVRPSKRIFRVTSLGERSFKKWLKTPVGHVRDLRMEFICKLFFYRNLGLPGASALVSEQIALLVSMKDSLTNRLSRDDPFVELLYSFKLKNLECILKWLREDATRFAEA